MVRLTKQLSIFLENRPGALARMCGILSEAEVNLYAMSVHDTVDHAIVRLVCEPHIKALLLLEQQGHYIQEQDVISMDVGNRVGSLATVARLLTHADINIAYAYCTATTDQQFGHLVLKSDEMERALELLTHLERQS